MKTIIAFMAMLPTILGAAGAAPSLPDRVAGQVKAVEAAFHESASTAYRVELLAIDPRIRVDAKLDAETFPSSASVTLSMDSGLCVEHIKRVVAEIRQSKWISVPYPGDPKCYWRIVGPWQSTLIDLIFDNEYSLVCSGGVWYKVDPKLTTAMTDFVSVAYKGFPLVNPVGSAEPQKPKENVR